MSEAAAAPPVEPLLRIDGDATPEEIAALVTVILARRSGPPKPARRSLWNAPSRQVRPRLSPGPGAWRASGLPR